MNWEAEAKRLAALIDSPEIHDFVAGVAGEAAHQRKRWGSGGESATRAHRGQHGEGAPPYDIDRSGVVQLARCDPLQDEHEARDRDADNGGRVILPGNDALKDQEVLAFLAEESDARVLSAWNERTSFIRLTDRLIEAGQLSGGGGWLAIAASDYVLALRDWTSRDLRLFTLDAHDRMLLELGGGAFRLLPFAGPSWVEIRYFGALDQLWNNIRDLREDLARGLCYFPDDILWSYRLRRADVREVRSGDPRWTALMQWWLDEYAPRVRARARPFIDATKLHPSLDRFRTECLRRYERIERVFRETGFDPVEFEARYWAREEDPCSPKP